MRTDTAMIDFYHNRYSILDEFDAWFRREVELSRLKASHRRVQEMFRLYEEAVNESMQSLGLYRMTGNDSFDRPSNRDAIIVEGNGFTRRSLRDYYDSNQSKVKVKTRNYPASFFFDGEEWVEVDHVEIDNGIDPSCRFEHSEETFHSRWKAPEAVQKLFRWAFIQRAADKLLGLFKGSR